jgi:hypothetical protein
LDNTGLPDIIMAVIISSEQDLEDCMNPATEIVLRWFFDAIAIEQELAEELLGVLAQGCAEREPSSMKAVADFVERARVQYREPPFDEVIRLALILHDELVDVEIAEHNLERFREIDRLLQAVPETVLGKRMVAMQVKKLVSELV